MKTLNTINRSKIIQFTGLLFLGLILFSSLGVYAQDFSTQDIKDNIQKETMGVIEIAKYIIHAVFAVAAIWMLYNVATHKPNAREHVIGYIVALVIWGLINMLIIK